MYVYICRPMYVVSSQQTGQVIACIRTAVKAYTRPAEPVLVEGWPNVADVQHAISPGCQPANRHDDPAPIYPSQ